MSGINKLSTDYFTGKINEGIEQIINTLTLLNEFMTILLRIANVIGMDPKANVFPKNNDLLSCLLSHDQLDVFGDNFSTIDHTAERDFIHVNDVVQAIILAFPKLNSTQKYFVYNIASGRTASVKDIIRITEHITHKTIMTKIQNRRANEIERVAIDPQLAQKDLDWHLQYPQPEYMIESSVDWLRNHGKS
jgi:UDP-glucose 4-epimerase